MPTGPPTSISSAIRAGAAARKPTAKTLISPARLGAAFVRGLQGDHPKYLKVSACAKHYAVHSGPEAIRTSFNAQVPPKLLHETYLPHFKQLVDAGVAVVMGAYNAVNGFPCCGSRFLLQDILRDQWGFKGYVVSDAGAISAFHRGHKAPQLPADDKQWGILAKEPPREPGQNVTRDALNPPPSPSPAAATWR